MKKALSVLVLVVGWAGLAAGDPPRPVKAALHSVHVESGFIDDAVALAPSGDLVAYVVCDGDVQTLTLQRIGGDVVARTRLSGLPPIIAKLRFSSDGKYLLVVGDDRERDAKVARIMTAAGVPVGAALGPVTEASFASLDGEEVATTFVLKRGKTETTYTFAAYALPSLKLKKKRTFTADKTGMVKGLEMKFVAFTDGLRRIVGQRKGEFDRANDIRKPDTISVVDALQGTLVSSSEIADPIGWAEVAGLRSQRPYDDAFLVVEELKTLVFVARDSTKKEIAIEEKMLKYEPKTLQQQLVGDRLYFTLTVDPVNPDITAKGKTDPPDVDLYVLEAGTDRAKRLLRIPSDRPIAWHIAGGRIVVLKKYKNFSRGGVDLHVYPVD